MLPAYKRESICTLIYRNACILKYKKTENEDIFIISRNVQFLTKITWNQFSTLLEFFRTLLEIVGENATLLENINTLLKIHSLCLLPQKAQFKPNFTVMFQHFLDQ